MSRDCSSLGTIPRSYLVSTENGCIGFLFSNVNMTVSTQTGCGLKRLILIKHDLRIIQKELVSASRKSTVDKISLDTAVVMI